MPTKLFPEVEEIQEIYSDVAFPDSSPDDETLPYVVINMVSSLDGKASAGRKSGAIGSDADRTSMRVLRSRVDAVISGSGTLRAERVSLTSEGRRHPEPLAVIPSVSLKLPLENLLHATPERTLILTTRASAKENETAVEELSRTSKVITCAEDANRGLDYEDALCTLKRDYGVGNLLVEGGPSLNHRLLSHTPSLVHELFLTIAPKVLGGEREGSHTIVEGALLDHGISADLISIYISDESEIFTRYYLNQDPCQE